MALKPVQMLEKEPELTEEDELETEDMFAGEGTPVKKAPMPDFPAKRISADKSYLLWDWVDKLDDLEFNHLMPYLYRSHPVINRQWKDSKAPINIDKLGTRETLNLDYIREHHGNGIYKILVNDVNKAVKGKGGTIGECMLVIEEPNNPPKLILEELVMDHPSNKSYVEKLIGNKEITSEGKIVMTQQPSGGNDPQLMTLVTSLVTELSKRANTPPARDSSTDIVGGMYSKAAETMMQMVKDNTKTDNDPLKMISAIKELLPNQDGNSAMLGMFMKLLSDSQSRENGTMLKVMEIMNAKKEAPEDAEDKMLDRIAKYKELFGGSNEGSGHSPKRSTLEVVLEAASPIASKVFDTVNLILQGSLMQKAGLMPSTAPPVQPIQAQLPSQPDNVVEMPQPPVDQFTMLLNQYGGMIVSAINNKTPGDRFAESIETMFGSLVYEGIASLGKEGIIAKLQAVPNVWNQIGGAPALVDRFIDEFLDFGTKEDDEEGE